MSHPLPQEDYYFINKNCALPIGTRPNKISNKIVVFF